MLASATGLALARRGRLGLPYVYREGRAVLPETVTVDLSVYDQIKDGLSLGLNGGDYELVSVTQEEDGRFTISMRRFGHGVGMSQRGAQWMAGEYGMDYIEILNFYYPGMTLETIDWPEVELTPLEELPESIGFARPRPTPTPTPAPLPALEEGEYYATVELETRSSSPERARAALDERAHRRRAGLRPARDRLRGRGRRLGAHPHRRIGGLCEAGIPEGGMRPWRGGARSPAPRDRPKSVSAARPPGGHVIQKTTLAVLLFALFASVFAAGAFSVSEAAAGKRRFARRRPRAT